MYFSNKRFLVQAERAEEDGFIDYGESVQPYFVGNIILKDEFGCQSVVTEQYFYDNYVGVRKLYKSKTPRKSPFELQAMAEGYATMGELVKQSNENNEDYIFEPNKSF
jgi:hypothetical protein